MAERHHGKHLGPTPFVHSPDFLPDSWLIPGPGRRIEVLVRAKGVIRLIQPMGREALLWPFSWIVHAALYRGHWAVEVVDTPDGGFWRWTVGRERLVQSSKFQSRREALTERARILDRIETLAKGATANE